MHLAQSYRIVFIITCIDSANILDCIQSITSNNHSLRCLLLVLLQNGITLSLEEYQTQLSEIKTFKTNSVLPLSQARNLLLKKEVVYEDAYYMFPDDDSLFDSRFFSLFPYLINGNTLIAVRGCQDASKYFLAQKHETKLSKRDFDKAISVNMVITGKTILQVGDFDENLGVGNYYGAGEDNDYFIRCCEVGDFVAINSLWNYHPLPEVLQQYSLRKMMKRYISYGRGVIYMLMKHRMRGKACKVVIRGYLGSVKNFVCFHWKMAVIYFVAANVRCGLFLKMLIKLNK